MLNKMLLQLSHGNIDAIPNCDLNREMSQSTLSVVIPTYYRNDRLVESISSVLNQDYTDIEIIVVDDSGEYHARDIVLEYDKPIEYVGLDENKGAQIARNVGYEKASGDFIQFLDDDDRLLDNKLQQQADILKNNPDIGVVYCGVRQEDTVSSPKTDLEGDVLKQSLMFDTWPCMYSTMLIRATVLDEIFPLDYLPGADDLDLIIQLAEVSKFAYVDQPLVLKRKSDNSRGRSVGAAMGRFKIINKNSNLFEKFPDKVKKSALSDAYRSMGSALVRQNTWSKDAIICYIKSLYYHNGFSGMLVIETIVTLFGNPGWRLASSIQNKILSGR
ncbi:glycosyltransferase family 2 protein [Haloferax gibbonsii]|uniref:glycosyltransferase family 2 protein n=1 Tax=Haloferax gibbonsii TaxID=35746 RepID=UPI0009E1E507|nr:glycosyltransferase family 2 protein [Haloferax gibbonsii]